MTKERKRKAKDKSQGLKYLLGNTSWLYVANFSGRFAGLLLTLFIASRLEISDYGFIGVVIAYCEVVNKLLDFRIWETMINYYGSAVALGERDNARKVLNFCYRLDFSTGVLAFIIVFLTANLAATHILGNPELGPLIQLYSVSLLINTVDGTSTAAIRVHKEFGWLGLQRTIRSFAQTGFIILLLLWRNEVRSVLLGYIATNILGAILVNTIAYRGVRRTFAKLENPPKQTPVNMRQMFSFMFQMNIYSTLTTVSSKLPILIVNALTTADQTGIFRLATRIAFFPRSLKQPLKQVFYPEFVKLKARNKMAESRRLVGLATFASFVLIGSLSLLIIAFMPWIFERISADSQYLETVRPTQIILVSVIVGSMLFWTNAIIIANEHTGLAISVELMRIVIWGVLGVLLIPTFGAVGGAITIATITIFKNILFGVIVWRKQLLWETPKAVDGKLNAT